MTNKFRFIRINPVFKMFDELLDTSKLVNELIVVRVVLTFCWWGNEKANITMHPKLLKVVKSGKYICFTFNQGWL